MRRASWLALASTASIVACASPWTVDRFEAPEANFAARHTYFLKAGEFAAPTPVDPALASQAEAAMRAAIATELQRKGYAEAETASAADMIVIFQVSGSRKFVVSDDRRIGAPSPNTVLSQSEIQPPPASALPTEHAMRESSVIVFVDDPASGRLVWRGLITAQTRLTSNEATSRTLANMARQIAREIPARQPVK